MAFLDFVSDIFGTKEKSSSSSGSSGSSDSTRNRLPFDLGNIDNNSTLFGKAVSFVRNPEDFVFETVFGNKKESPGTDGSDNGDNGDDNNELLNIAARQRQEKILKDLELEQQNLEAELNSQREKSINDIVKLLAVVKNNADLTTLVRG